MIARAVIDGDRKIFGNIVDVVRSGHGFENLPRCPMRNQSRLTCLSSGAMLDIEGLGGAIADS